MNWFSSMAVDYTISIGNIIEIVSIIGGGIAVLVTLKGDVSALKAGSQILRLDFAGMQAELKKLSDILVNLADIRGEIKAHDARISANEQDIREMRHGDGFVRGRASTHRTSIDGEYP